MVTKKVTRGYMQEEAYKKLLVWKNICELRRLIYKITERFAKTHPRLAGQMRDATRSAKQNFIEGYKRDSIGLFIQSVKVSRGSLGELDGDIDDCYEDNLITKLEYTNLSNLSKKSLYLIDRYIDSLYKMQKEKTWRVRWQK